MKLKVAFLLSVLAIAPVFASDEPIDPRKFDEFGTLGHCDLGARLDNFAIRLQHEPNAIGHIVAYGPEGEGPGTGKHFLNIIKDYLVTARGLPEQRINPINAGRNRVIYQPLFELWIAPPGAAAPEPPRFESSIDTFKGRLITEQAHDFIDMLTEDSEEMGPGIGLSTDAALADLLQHQKKAVAYIVTYNGEAAVPGSSRRMAERKLNALKLHHVDLKRVKTIFGGVRKKTEIELWITAPGDPPPVKDAGPEPPPLKNAEITQQADFTLGKPENERAVFNRMLQVLRDQPTLKIVVIVQLQASQPDSDFEPESTQTAVALPEEPAEPLSVEEEDDPPADLPKLVQKWREELINTHKIRLDRFIVLFATEEFGNYLKVWAVPPGQPLPNPNADEEDASDVVQDPKRRP